MQGSFNFIPVPLPPSNQGNEAPLLWPEGTNYFLVTPGFPMQGGGEEVDVNGVKTVYDNLDRKYVIANWFELLGLVFQCLHNNTYNIPAFQDRRHGTYGFQIESEEGQQRVRDLLAEIQNRAGLTYSPSVSYGDQALANTNLVVVYELAKKLEGFIVPERMFAPENRSEPVIVQLRFNDSRDPLNVVLNQFSAGADLLANAFAQPNN